MNANVWTQLDRKRIEETSREEAGEAAAFEIILKLGEKCKQSGLNFIVSLTSRMLIISKLNLDGVKFSDL